MPDNYLDVPGKRWLEEALRATPKSVLFVSHDRELPSRVPDRIVTVELGTAGNSVWGHRGAFDTYHTAWNRSPGCKNSLQHAGSSSTLPGDRASSWSTCSRNWSSTR